jgi:hypothetical protein
VTLNSDVSVSTALEYDLSFAALGHLAESLGKSDDANYLFGRAMQYREMYNAESGFLQQRKTNGDWDQSFGGYTEGNQWIYLWFVPQDVEGLVDLFGGAPAFDKRLDQFFSENRYDPTNEPDLQAPFLYDFIDRPWKTQHIVAETADKCFTDTPGGLAGGGNDDLGTMSAWYVLSQMGFYFVDPGMPYVEVCTPRFSKIELHLAQANGGKSTTFEIDSPNGGGSNEYITSTNLNGKSLTKPWFAESDITGGGTWSVQTSSTPDTDWASSPLDRPYSLSSGWLHLPKNGIITPIAADGRTLGQLWKYSTSKPADDWYASGFDDSSWKTGEGAFGTADEGVTPRTPWNTDDIWIRRSFTLPAGFTEPDLVVYHDQSAEVYVNGLLVTKFSTFTHNYDPVQLPEDVLRSLKAGTNVLAIHVHHDGDGRHYADAGVVTIAWPDDEK